VQNAIHLVVDFVVFISLTAFTLTIQSKRFIAVIFDVIVYSEMFLQFLKILKCCDLVIIRVNDLFFAYWFSNIIWYELSISLLSNMKSKF
jgi:hypothetical protein